MPSESPHTAAIKGLFLDTILFQAPISRNCNRGLRLPRTTALTHPTLFYHSRHDRSREGRERKEVRLGRCGANDAYGGDKEWRHRDRAVGGLSLEM